MLDHLSMHAKTVLALHEENQREEPSEAVIAACEAALFALNMEARYSNYIEMSQKEDV